MAQVRKLRSSLVFILAFLAIELNGCGGSSASSYDDDNNGNGAHLLACRRNLHDGANRHHLRRHRRRDDLLHHQRNDAHHCLNCLLRRDHHSGDSGYRDHPGYRRGLGLHKLPGRIRRLYDLLAPGNGHRRWRRCRMADPTGEHGVYLDRSHRRIRKRAADSQESWREHHPHPHICESHHHLRRLWAWATSIRRGASRWPNRPMRWASRS
jgi:hypothetical protein